MKRKKSTLQKKYPKMTRAQRARAAKYIREEYHAGRHGKQAVAIGLSREREVEKKSEIERIIAKYR
jgi:hypothetical protein